MARGAMPGVSAVVSASALSFVFACCAPASAQGTSPAATVPAANDAKWEFEVHFGSAATNQPTAGTPIAAFPVGEAFTSLIGRPGRYASSWYFGDGATILNQAAAGFLGIPVAGRITPLDPVLTKASVRRQGGASLGVRVSRRLTPRLAAELSVDSFAGAVRLTDAALEGIEATRASFAPTWAGIIATGNNVLFTNGTTSSTTALVNDTNRRQTSLTGAVNFALSDGTRLMPYLTAGGGALIRSGDLPSATLTGNYQFRFVGVAPFSESDVAKVHFAAKDTAMVGVFGGGAKYALSRGHGLRVDLRVHVSPNSLETRVDARPATAPGPPFSIPSATTPALVFSNAPETRSTLSGPPITDLKTFAGSGSDIQTSLTVGYFLRVGSVPGRSLPRAPRVRAAALTGPRWELEGHAGGAFGKQPAAGTPIGAFPVGASFTTPFLPSRYASTWYFGDGAVLINQIAAAFTGTTATTVRVTPLDPVLTTAGVERRRGATGGLRLARRVTPMISAEIGVDSTAASLKLTDRAIEGLEATRASFTPMWSAIIATGSGIFLSPHVSSTSTLAPSADSRETLVTGAANFMLSSNGRVVPYLTAGAGVLIRSGDLPSATLTGNYQFRFFIDGAPVSESDVVKVHFAAKDRTFVGLFGGGVKYAVSPRHGLRLDVRVHLGANSLDTLVDAHPATVTRTPPFFISSGTNPSLVFSNTSAMRSNLTGPAIVDLKTFTGSGLDLQTNLTVGYFVRF